MLKYLNTHLASLEIIGLFCSVNTVDNSFRILGCLTNINWLLSETIGKFNSIRATHKKRKGSVEFNRGF